MQVDLGVGELLPSREAALSVLPRELQVRAQLRQKQRLQRALVSVVGQLQSDGVPARSGSLRDDRDTHLLGSQVSVFLRDIC